MTPKEKAEELCYLYQGDFEKDTLNMSWTMAKKCTLIAVAEILNLDIDTNVLDYWYWHEVKQEIQKL